MKENHVNNGEKDRSMIRLLFLIFLQLRVTLSTFVSWKINISILLLPIHHSFANYQKYFYHQILNDAERLLKTWKQGVVFQAIVFDVILLF